MTPKSRRELLSELSEKTRMAAYKHAKDLKEIQDLSDFIMLDGVVPVDVYELQRGDKVRYSFRNHGMDGQRNEIAKTLTLNATYEVARKELYSSSTDIWLVGFDKPFNSVFFSSVFPQWEK